MTHSSETTAKVRQTSTAPLRGPVTAKPDFADERFRIASDKDDIAQAADPGAEIIGPCSPWPAGALSDPSGIAGAATTAVFPIAPFRFFKELT